jgi:hypothetical protein
VGRPSSTGGVSARGSNGVQYDFMLEGVRYRPMLKQTTTEANLRCAREHLNAIKERIRLGTFSFAEEFPDFRDLHKLINRSPWRTCNLRASGHPRRSRSGFETSMKPAEPIR